MDAPDVALVDIDDERLEQLLILAHLERSPAEVMAPLPGSPGWGAEADDAYRRNHRERRAGLDGPHGEVTYAVTVGGEVVGSLRLFRPHRSAGDVVAGDGVGGDIAGRDILEAGLWLAPGRRRRGTGGAVLAQAVERARDLGARRLDAETTSANSAAQAALRWAGFTLGSATPEGNIHAELPLG